MSSITAPKTVLLKGNPYQDEKICSGALVPGDFVTRNSSHLLVWGAHGASEKPIYVVKDHDLTGKGIDDAYTSGDQVPYYVCPPGTWVYARIKASQAVPEGTLLMAAGTDGTLQLVTSGGTPIARAVEALSSVASIQRMRVEVL